MAHWQRRSPSALFHLDELQIADSLEHFCIELDPSPPTRTHRSGPLCLCLGRALVCLFAFTTVPSSQMSLCFYECLGPIRTPPWRWQWDYNLCSERGRFEQSQDHYELLMITIRLLSHALCRDIANVA